MERIRKIRKFLSTLDYRHYICLGLTLGFICFWGQFPNALGRFLDGAWDICTSFAYSACELVNGIGELLFDCETLIEHNITPTVNNLPNWTSGGLADNGALLPLEWAQFQKNWDTYWTTWANWTYVELYLLYVAYYGLIVSHFLYYVIVAVFLFRMWLKRYLERQPAVQFDEHGKAVNANVDSKALAKYRAFLARYIPVKRWCGNFVEFVRANAFWWKIWLCLFAFYFNVFTIALELLAFIIYFLTAFDYAAIYRQFYKLALDFSPFLKIPVWTWIVTACVLFSYFGRKTGKETLTHFQNYDRGFNNTRSLFTIICATVGAGKTTMLVLMGIFDNLNHRDRAFEDMLKNDLKFPNFPWINLEKSLLRAIESGIVRDLKTTRDFIRSRKRYFDKHATARNCFDYDFCLYGYTYNDGLKIATVWDVMESYAQQYFIYVMSTSILANFGIRLDDIKEDLGHFPLWNTDFLSRDPRLMDAYSRHCKILDFNALRIGMKMVSENDYVYNFEFGTILITEVGKELMNDKELRELGVKFIALDANQKNDGTINEIKLIRHAATVDGFPYVVIRTDEQRPESLGANARDLFEIIYVRERSERKVALPFFAVVDLLYASIFNKFAQVYYQYRFVRSDNTLPMYLLKAFTAAVEHYYERTCNQYGYRVLKGEIERGTMDGTKKAFKYYLIDKIIYAKRFATDCYSGYFDERLAQSTVGLAGVPEYATEKATFEEMKKQNSYMVKNLLQGINDEN